MSTDIPAQPNDESKALANTPKLSSSGLTKLLILMCTVPVVTIATLNWYMPPVFEGQLEASISAEGLPPGSYYDTHYTERAKVPTGVLVVNNISDQDWTHLNIQINKHYQIYEHEPILAGKTKRFRLDRFVNKTGATFDVRYNPLRYVRIYARRPTKDRATFVTEFDWESVE